MFDVGCRCQCSSSSSSSARSSVSNSEGLGVAEAEAASAAVVVAAMPSSLVVFFLSRDLHMSGGFHNLEHFIYPRVLKKKKVVTRERKGHSRVCIKFRGRRLTSNDSVAGFALGPSTAPCVVVGGGCVGAFAVVEVHFLRVRRGGRR